MFDAITLNFLSNASAWVVTAAVSLSIVRLIYKGKLVPETTVRMERDALAAERATNAELRAALLEYQSMGTAAIHLLESIQSDHREGRLDR